MKSVVIEVVVLLLLQLSCVSGDQLNTDQDPDQAATGWNEIHQVEDSKSRLTATAENQRAAAAVNPPAQQSCLTDIHTVLRELSSTVAELKVELTHTKELLRDSKAELTKKLSLLETRSNLTESHVEGLRKDGDDKKVAFSAALYADGNGEFGPHSIGITVVYRHIFTNIGNAYNPATGVFTAPTKGLYLFRFYIYGHGSSSIANSIALHKNGHRVAIAYGHQASYAINASNGVSLVLEAGDVVYTYLLARSRIYDNGKWDHQLCSFSGHLLFTM